MRPPQWRGRRAPAPATLPAEPDPGGAAGGRRHDVLALLQDAPAPLGVADLAEALDVHPNTVRFHLDALVDRGQVIRVHGPRRRPGRPPTLFQAVPTMDPDGPRHFLTLAELLVEDLAASPDPPARARAAGHRWGARIEAPSVRTSAPQQQAADQLLCVLTRLGFAPETESESTVRLRHCPFLELARDNPAVVCSVHLGILQGALEAWAAPLTVPRLEPFAEPNICRVHLESESS